MLVIKTACLQLFRVNSVKKKTEKQLFAQMPSKMAVIGGKKMKINVLALFSLIIFQEKSCCLWMDVLVSMSKMYTRTWPAMGNLWTSFINLCWFCVTQMPGLALEAVGQDYLRKVWQKKLCQKSVCLLFISLHLAVIQFTSTGISCCFSSHTIYARTDLNFIFKLFCYPNLLSWNSDLTIGRGKIPTLQLWASCGQHLQDKKLKQKYSRSLLFSSVMDMKNLVKWQKIVSE